MLNKMNKKDEKGFTLIELMIVIAIIGILAAIAIPNFNAYRARSYNTSANADLRNIITSLEGYYVDFDKYPTIAANAAATDLVNYGYVNSDGVNTGAVSYTAATSSYAIGNTINTKAGTRAVTYYVVDNTAGKIESLAP